MVKVLLLAIGSLYCLGSAAGAAELKVLAPIAVKGILGQLIPDFETKNVVKVIVETATLPQVAQRAAAGRAFDVIIAPDTTIQKLRSEKIASDAVRPFGVAHIAIAYRKGAPARKVSTLDEVRDTIRNADSIATTDGGTTALYFINVAKQLGMEEELKRKTVLGPPGQGALPVFEGKAEIGVAQSSEISELKNLDRVPLLPKAPASETRFLAAVAANAHDAHLADMFLNHLVSKETERRRVESGFEMANDPPLETL